MNDQPRWDVRVSLPEIVATRKDDYLYPEQISAFFDFVRSVDKLLRVFSPESELILVWEVTDDGTTITFKAKMPGDCLADFRRAVEKVNPVLDDGIKQAWGKM